VKVLRDLFRGKYLALLQQSYRAGALRFHGTLKPLAEPAAFARLMKQSRRRKWVVYAKPPFRGREVVLEYLARYTHRIAIANSRLLSISEDAVRFTWKDYRHGSRLQPLALAPGEFIRRFLLHVLPPGFVRIRRYGILANCQREARLARCRELLADVDTASHTPRSDPAEASEDKGATCPQDPAACRRCEACGQGRMRVIEEIAPEWQAGARAPPALAHA
jgi:hypothetical protein